MIKDDTLAKSNALGQSYNTGITDVHSCLVAGSWKDMTKKFRDGMANEVGACLRKLGRGWGHRGWIKRPPLMNYTRQP